MRILGIIISVICYIISIVLDHTVSATSCLQPFKYLLAAFSITFFTYLLLSNKIQKYRPIIGIVGIIILVIYVLILFDTYFFHAMSWFPGIIRYAMFSAYIPISVLFIIPGICLCFLKK